MAIRQAIITYNADIVSGWSSATEASINHILWLALRGENYPRERGIMSIRHIPDGNELIVAPNKESDVLMSYSPAITLPLDLLERLVVLAEKGAGRGGADSATVRAVREQIAGTRKQFDNFEIVVVPKVRRED